MRRRFGGVGFLFTWDAEHLFLVDPWAGWSTGKNVVDDLCYLGNRIRCGLLQSSNVWWIVI